MENLPSLEVLIVEDNVGVRKAITSLLKRFKYSVEAVGGGLAALEKLENKYYDLVISDYRMPDIDGIELLSKIKTQWPATEVIIITAFGTISRSVKAIKLGAFDYITKPFEPDELLRIVARFVEARKAGNRLKNLSQEIRRQSEFDTIIGKSDEILGLMDLIARVATKASTILIYGESGTGKELVAKSIHALSSRKDKPFIAINCGAIPENLQESELFGHAKGAFTGASFEKKGLFEVADGGTIFLDEVAEMASSTQVTLLRFLQEQEVRRVGDSVTRVVDVRLIAATNKNLEHEIKKQTFREDLYYRVNVIPLQVPPLRERKKDIPLLVEHFIEKYRKRDGGPVNKVSKRALAILMNHDWPGNVRELENVVHRCVALGMAEEITPDLLPQQLRERHFETEALKSGGRLADMEKTIILETLEKHDGNKKKTAEALGISKTTLWRKLKE